MDTNSGYSRVAKNTLILYLRMLLTMGISFWTTRIVLQALGVDDYGIYNVLGGMVALCSVLTGSLQVSISRYITIELGRGDTVRLQRIFSSSVWVMTALALLIGVVAEGFGQWFVRCEMSIQPDNVGPALWAMQCFIVSFMLQLVCAPYNSLLIAHERMGALAAFTVLNKIVALGIAYLALWSPVNRLIVYAVAMMLLDVAMRILYNMYCARQFEECRLSFRFDRDLFKDMGAFTGWAFLGNAGYHISVQGTSMVLNVFCGLAVNAARGLATQVSGALESLVNNFMCAVNPQITKSYSANEISYMHSLILKSARFSFLIFFIIAGPICLNIDYILRLWLSEVPLYTSQFVIISIVTCLIGCLFKPLLTAILANGNIKNFEFGLTIVYIIQLLVFTILLSLGNNVVFVISLTIVFQFLHMALLLYFSVKLVNLNIIQYLKEAILPALKVSVIIILLHPLKFLCSDNFAGHLAYFTLCMILTSVAEFYLGMNKSERNFVLKRTLGYIKVFAAG